MKPCGSILDLVQALAPNRNDIVVLVHSYFDESETSDSLCVAGYVFRKPAVRKFETEWRRMLHAFGLPYFRMSACNSNAPPFHNLTKDQCIDAQIRAVHIISRHASFGFSAVIRPQDFFEIVGREGFVLSPYELLAWNCIIAVKAWCDRTHNVSGVSYFFEAGFQDQGKANEMMNELFVVPALRQEYKYRPHAFVDKSLSMPSQAADMLAWSKAKHIKRIQSGATTRRADFNALLEGTVHHSCSLKLSNLDEMIRELVSLGGPDANKRAGLAMRPQRSRSPNRLRSGGG